MEALSSISEPVRWLGLRCESAPAAISRRILEELRFPPFVRHLVTGEDADSARADGYLFVRHERKNQRLKEVRLALEMTESEPCLRVRCKGG